jgi:hypothetical protein
MPPTGARPPLQPGPLASGLSRREFLRAAGAAALASGALPLAARAAGEAAPGARPESLVEALYASLSPEQRSAICFPWDHVDPELGLLRSRVAANWRITEPELDGGFYSPDQRALVRAIFEGITSPEWHARFDRQLEDDAGGFGRHQAIAIFGEPGASHFEFVLTGRHMTLRCDGNSAQHVAFGGPIFYGHANGTWWSAGFVEKAAHPGNVFWHQALEANRLYGMLDGRQRELALLEELPEESAVPLQGAGGRFPGIPLAELSPDQREEAQRVLRTLIDPFRQSDRDEVVAALRAQGGLDRCSLAFYREGDVGGDGVWDCFRLEGPAFVWYFRGAPHVHVWVHVADAPGVELNARLPLPSRILGDRTSKTSV